MMMMMSVSHCFFVQLCYVFYIFKYFILFLLFKKFLARVGDVCMIN